MIDLVTLAEDSIEKLRVRKLTKITSNTKSASIPDIAPILRGLLTHATNNVTDQEKKIILEFRNNKKIRDYINGTDIQTYSQKGTVTPDHVIRVNQNLSFLRLLLSINSPLGKKNRRAELQNT